MFEIRFLVGSLVLSLGICLGATTGTGQEHSTDRIEVAEPADYRINDYRSPVPSTLQGARVVDAAGAQELLTGEQAILVDVYPQAPKPPGLPAGTIWRTPKHTSIAGAVWLPNVGYGKLAEEPENYFRKSLERLSSGNKHKTLIFFCLRDCWMSWNAAKRAMEWGYSNVVWFPDGVDGWRELGNRVADVNPEPKE
ncbi:MAG: PQQ-dependent catabolism-associated CXXCW motif protein [Hyphomicrobiaceae bacterium]